MHRSTEREANFRGFNFRSAFLTRETFLPTGTLWPSCISTANWMKVEVPLVSKDARTEADEDVKELYAYGAGLQSLSDVVGLDRFSKLEFLSLHGNHIQCIRGLDGLVRLKELNLSSNKIKHIEGLSSLFQLQTLNLSCNLLEEIAGLQGLLALRKLLLSHNHISHLGGLSALHGPRYPLQVLDLRDNAVRILTELDVLAGLSNLVELVFSWGSHSNPVCQAPAYRSTVVAAVPYILKLDGGDLCPAQGPGCPKSQSPLASEAITIQPKNAAIREPPWASQSRTHGLSLHDPFVHCEEVTPLSQVEQSGAHLRQPNPQLSNFCSNGKQANIRPLDDGYEPIPGPIRPNSIFSKGRSNLDEPSDAKAGPAAVTDAGGASGLFARQVEDTQSREGDFQTIHHSERPPSINNSSSSHIVSMRSLSHPHCNQRSACPDFQFLQSGQGLELDKKFSGDSRNEFRGSRKQPASFPVQCYSSTVRGRHVLPEVKHADLRVHEAWLGTLKARILDLVQLLPNERTLGEREVKDHVDGDESEGIALDGFTPQRLDWIDTSGEKRRNRKGSATNQNETDGDASGRDALASSGCKSRSKSTVGPLLVTEDNGSQSSEIDSPPRRWVHLGDTWKRRKNVKAKEHPKREDDHRENNDALEASLKEDSTTCGLVGIELKQSRGTESLHQLFKEVKNLQAGLASLTAMYKDTNCPPVLSEANRCQRETVFKQKEAQETSTKELVEQEKGANEVATCKLMELCSLLEGKLLNSEERFSEETRNLLKSLRTEQEEKSDLRQRLEAEQIEKIDLRTKLEAELEEKNCLHDKLEVEFEERNNLQKRFEKQEATIVELEKMMQHKDKNIEELSGQIEQFKAELGQKDIYLQEKYHRKFLSLTTQLVALKEALSIATFARQKAETGHMNAVSEKETKQQSYLAAKQMLDDERAKLKACQTELEICKAQRLEALEKVDKHTEDLLNFQEDKEGALKELEMHHKADKEREFAAGKCQGINEAKKDCDQLRVAMEVKLMNARKELQDAHEEIGNIRRQMEELREDKEREEPALKKTIRELLLKVQDKEALVVELSNVVHSQRMKLQEVQLDLERLLQVEERVKKWHGEMISLRRRADESDALAAEVTRLQDQLTRAASDAEKAMQGVEARGLSQTAQLQEETSRLEDCLRGAEDAVKVKNKMLDSQNETVKNLKIELSQAKEAFKSALKASESMEAEWINRLHTEVRQGEELQIENSKQAQTILSLKDKLRLESAAKMAADEAAETLKEKVAEKEGMLRYVEEEILQVKELYDKKVAAVEMERDQGVEGLKRAHQDKERLEKDIQDAQTRGKTLTDQIKLLEVQNTILQKEGKKKSEEISHIHQQIVDMKLQAIAMEEHKVNTVTKLNQVQNLLEELRGDS